MGKKTVNGVADAFMAGLDKQIEEEEAKKKKKGPDTTAFDKAVLEQIGKENLKKAVAKLSFASLYKFLKEAGFMGDKARLADLLDGMGVRAKVDIPEHLKKKCDKCGTVVVKYYDLWLCLDCGRAFKLNRGKLKYEGTSGDPELSEWRKKNGWKPKQAQQG